MAFPDSQGALVSSPGERGHDRVGVAQWLSTFCETVSLNLWSLCEPDMVVWNCDPTSPVLRWEAKAGEPPEALGPATLEYAVCWGLRKMEGDYQHLSPISACMLCTRDLQSRTQTCPLS